MPVTARREEIKTRNKLQPIETSLDLALTWPCCILSIDKFHDEKCRRSLGVQFQSECFFRDYTESERTS